MKKQFLFSILFLITASIGFVPSTVFAAPNDYDGDGIPTFILGAIMGLFFLGGHLLFVIVFFAGIFIYIRKLLGVVYTLPTKNPNINNNNNNTPNIKSKSVGY